MVSVRSMCSMLVLGFNASKWVSQMGMGACFFLNFLLFRIMCVSTL